MHRTIRPLPHRTNSQYLKLIRIVTRSLSADYNNPSQQLVEENSNLNYRIYYQYGLPTVEDLKEFVEFNDKIWYGQEGKEMVVKLKEMPKWVKSDDIFLMRDYHNNKIIGFNAIHRVSSTFDKIFNTNKYGNGAFNYVIRSNTSITPELQGKGYGTIIRKYSRELEALHINNQGVSITMIQSKNTPSINLQLKYGFEMLNKINYYQYYRHNLSLPDEISTIWDIVRMKTVTAENEPEWNRINVLHNEYIKKHGIIDLSITSNEVYSKDPEIPVYVLKAKGSDNILAVFQGIFVYFDIICECYIIVYINSRSDNKSVESTFIGG